jgi:hypothetical protein
MIRLLTILAVLLTATPALACPTCAIKDTAGLGSWFILAGMILFPFFVVSGVLFALRKLAIIGDAQ